MTSPKMRYSLWSSSSGKVKARERRENAGNVVKAITTAEIARMTKRTTAGQMEGRGRIRKTARQAKMQVKDETQARAIGAAGDTVRAKENIGTCMASPEKAMPEQKRNGARQR